MKTCEECGGSGICPECKGEGFVLKKLSDESAERARLTAKNAATRYTAAYAFLVFPPISPFPNLIIKILLLNRALISGFQRNGAIVQNALLLGLVIPAVASER